MANNLLGSGLIFPIELINGSPKIATEAELIKASLRILLSWDIRRFMLYEFYSRIHDLLEEPNDEVMGDLIRYFTVTIVTKFEPRVVVIESITNRITAVKLEITLRYQIISSRSIDSFIFPFYTNKIY